MALKIRSYQKNEKEQTYYTAKLQTTDIQYYDIAYSPQESIYETYDYSMIQLQLNLNH